MDEPVLTSGGQPVTAIARHFADLPDPRVRRTREHDLIDIITLAICAFICGADGWTDVEEFGRDKERWLRTFLRLPGGIPSHDTFGRVFAMLDAAAFADCPTASMVFEHHQSTEGDPRGGRVEVRKVWCTDRIDEATARLDPWPGLRRFVMVERHRTTAAGTSVERADYIASHEHTTAKWLSYAIRGHWAIENKLHWSLDVAFDEDRSRVRTGHAAANMALLRKIALNLLKRETTCKRGLAAKRLKAGWSEPYLLRVLQGGI